MKAVVFRSYGPPDVLRLADIPKPKPKPNQVLIRVRAAGVNPSDAGLRRGDLKWLFPVRLPKIPGSEVAGVVEAVGQRVTTVRPGERVVALLGHRGGGYAEYAVANADRVVKLPDTVSFEQGAAVPVAGITALQALRNIAHTRPGDAVLVNGASGGVGTMGVQIARILGATVTGVCSAANVDLVREVGADRVIDYERDDFTQLPDRYQTVFDAVNKRTFRDCRRVLTPIGTYVTTRPSRQMLPQLLLNPFRGQKFRFIGARDRGPDVQWLVDHLQTGELEAIIAQTYPLEQSADAHRYSETGRVRGKLILTIP